MLTKDKVTEFICIVDDFCNVFDVPMENVLQKHFLYPIKSLLSPRHKPNAHHWAVVSPHLHVA